MPGATPSTRKAATALLAAVALAAILSPAVLSPAAVNAQKGQAPASASAAAAAPAASTGGAIQGYVYLDADGDGAFGPAESAVAGVPIRLVGAEGADAAATDVDGLYKFTGLAAGTYDVAIDTTALAVVLGSTDGLDVPGYDALSVVDETLSGVNFALDSQQVSRLATALARAVAAVQAALPNGRPGVAATDATTATSAVTATEATTATDTTTATGATEANTVTEATTATTATVRSATKGGRQMSEAAAAMTTTARTASTDASAARAGTTVTATSDAGDGTGTGMAGAVAVAETAPGSPATMPGGGLADLFGPGALAGLAGVLSVLGGIGALRRRR